VLAPDLVDVAEEGIGIVRAGYDILKVDRREPLWFEKWRTSLPVRMGWRDIFDCSSLLLFRSLEFGKRKFGEPVCVDPSV
jgi:hypothetical protein